jgi:hypothetical protein
MTADTEALARWWDGLSKDEREGARALSQGEKMPADLLVSLTHAGLPQAAAWWPSTQDGPTFTVPAAVVEFVSRQS